MRALPDLRLHEQILLLALHDKKGTLHTSMFSYAVAGAIVAELVDSGRLRIEQHQRQRVLAVADPSSMADPLLDECIRKIATATRHAAAATWVKRFASIKELKERIAERLCHRGILARSEDRVLWVFPRVVYPTADPGPELDIVAALRDAIVSDGEVDVRTGIVIALAHTAGILSHVFDSSLLKARSARIDAIARSDDVSGAAKDTLEAAHAAVAALTAFTADTAAARG